MLPKPKGRGNGKPVRRSGRASKHKTFGSDFEMEDPPRARKRARKEPEPDPPPSTDPKPGTSSDPVPDPDPDPSSPKKLKWDSDHKHWRQPMLPTNHSKHSFIFVSDSVSSEAPFAKRRPVGQWDT